VKKSQAGGGVAVKIEHAVYQSAKMFGRHFDDKDELLSHITRQSIDVLKVRNLVPSPCFHGVNFGNQTSFKADVSNDEWLLIKALKPVGTVTALAFLSANEHMVALQCSMSTRSVARSVLSIGRTPKYRISFLEFYLSNCT
jgi:hypothetical protein